MVAPGPVLVVELSHGPVDWLVLHVGAYNVTGVRRCHGNHQSRMSDDDSTEHIEGHHRMSDDDSTEHVEGHQLRTHQNTCLNVRTR